MEDPDAEVTEALQRSSPTTYSDAIREVYELYAKKHGKPRYGDKTPRYSIDIPLLTSLFPEARFIHIIRDGRDVSLSLMDVRLDKGTFAKQPGCGVLASQRPVDPVSKSAPVDTA